MIEQLKELESILRIAPTGIGVARDRILCRVSDRFCEITGYSREELIGQSARMLYPTEEDFLEVGREKYRQIREKGTGTVETRFRHKDGKIVDILMSSTPLDTENLNAGVTFTALDITPGKQAKKDLEKSEKRYRAFIHSMDDAAYICSSDRKIEFMNPAMAAIAGEDALGKTCYRAIYGFDTICPWCEHEHILKGKVFKNEVFNPKNELTYHTSSTPLAHGDDSVSVLSVFRDITELKKMESRIQQSQKMESIGTLAAGIAHDFNNILFPIIGYSEMLLEDIRENQDARESLEQIQTAAFRAKELIQQILTFSRQEQSEARLIRIQPIIKETVKFIRSGIPTTIQIKTRISPDCGVIKADPTQIHQILLNLTTNAFHAMEETGGELSVILDEKEIDALPGSELSPGNYARLTVKDTGIGMDRELIKKIFDPFFTTKGKSKGTGMGLSVVHGIVKGGKGEISVYSEPGKGSEFRVFFPIAKSFAGSGQRSSASRPIRGGTEHILLVDDEAPIIAMEKQMLQRLGYEVTSMTSSLEALDLFRSHPLKFDLVITDLAMPNLPGDQFSKEVNRIRPDIPILLCSGFSETMSRQTAERIGIRACLNKPILTADLAHTIREVLDSKI